MSQVSKAPIFVVGCHRSGTSFLYHCLLSSGGFPVYRSDATIWDRLIPLCGDPSVLKNRQKMTSLWLQSKQFRRTGLEAKQIEARLLAECRTGGDFLRIVMEEMARSQKLDRWASWNPDHTFYMPDIKRELPDALFIHIIRDGRDVATVLNKKGWIRPFPWDRKKSLLVAGVFWEWMVRAGREHGQRMGRDYLEVRYEDLALRPRKALAKIGDFINHDLDFDRIQNAGVGVVSDPNSTFKTEFTEGQFNPVGRWREKLSSDQVRALEKVIGGLLKELDYPLATSDHDSSFHPELKTLRAFYLSFFKSKVWLKSNTPLGRFVSAAPLELA